MPAVNCLANSPAIICPTTRPGSPTAWASLLTVNSSPAPSIQSKIGKEGEITGSFTEVEVSDLVAVLNAGSLPVRLRLVEGDTHSR